MLLQLPHQAYQIYQLMIVSQKPDNNSRCDVAYPTLFSYHWFNNKTAYADNTDDWLIKPLCSMFLPGSLVFSICHLSNLVHHLHVCLCYKSKIVLHFYSQIETVPKFLSFTFLRKDLVVGLNESNLRECEELTHAKIKIFTR